MIVGILDGREVAVDPVGRNMHVSVRGMDQQPRSLHCGKMAPSRKEVDIMSACEQLCAEKAPDAPRADDCDSHGFATIESGLALTPNSWHLQPLS